MRIIGLDVGTKRIGVAKADTSVKIAIPDGVVMVQAGREFAEIAKIARNYGAEHFVIGLPRSNDGNETAQSKYVRNFARTLTQTIPHAKIRFQDESLTSVQAKTNLKQNGKTIYKNQGEIDTEAACLILQDFLESFSVNRKQETDFTTADRPDDYLDAIAGDPVASKADKTSGKTTKQLKAKLEKSQKKEKEEVSKPKKSLVKKFLTAIVAIVITIGVLGAGGFVCYNELLKPVSASEFDEIKFTVAENESVPVIATNLEQANLIRSKIAFQIYAAISGHTTDLKVGEYNLKKSMSVPDIINQIVAGAKSGNVFSLTILPGETIRDIKKKLLAVGYDNTMVEAAFSKEYDHPILKDKPAGVSLEGYLYGETYEFYQDETIENIITRAMDELYSTIVENDFETKFKAHGLNLHEGITLASIVQKESGNAEQMRTVAQVFLLRLDQGIMLGSDVTSKYAADLVDPERKTYKDNASIIALNNPYNTRKVAGLPPGAIAQPGFDALNAVANPTNTTYLYFLTGDDGAMYYSNTEEEHLQNAAAHCQTLCNVSL